MEDVPRLAVVATAAFRDSDSFQWYRPKHNLFPLDTIAWLANMFAEAIRDPKAIVLMVEDLYKQEEAHNQGALPSASKAPVEGDNVLVGVAVFDLPEGSKLVGQLMDKDDEALAAEDQELFSIGEQRDMDCNRWDVWCKAYSDAAEK